MTAGPVTVVVCTRDRPAELAECLAAVRACLRPGDRLVVVDSASRDGRTVAVAEAAGAAVVRLDRPGLSRARNAGLAAAQTPVVLFTDDDCRPRPGWVEAVAGAFAADDRLGFVTGRVLADGDGAPTVVDDRMAPQRLDRTTPLERMGHGANLAVRADAVLGVGGFDPLLGAGARFRAGEDTDIYRRLLRAGWHGRFEPAAAVGHRQWRSRAQAVRMAYGYGLGFGAVGVKAWRDERAVGRAVLWRGVGPAGLGRAWRDLRSRYLLGVLVCLAWTGGVLAGAVRVSRLPVDGGVLQPREVAA